MKFVYVIAGYFNLACELPNYQSKSGKINAVSSNGTQVQIYIKKVNWFGMES